MYNVVMGGEVGAGRSNLVRRLRGEPFVDSEPKSDDVIEYDGIFDGEPAHLSIWDMELNVNYSESTEEIISRIDGVLLVYRLDGDLTAQLEYIDEERQRFSHIREDRGASIVIVATKADLSVRTADLSAYAQQWQLNHIETSSKTSHNVHEAFATLVRHMGSHYQRERATTDPADKRAAKLSKCSLF